MRLQGMYGEGEAYLLPIYLYFYLKKEDINMVAKLNYDLYSDKLILEGKYEAYSIAGKFKAVKEDHTVRFIVNSDTFSDLKTLIDRLPLKKKLNE